MRRSQCASRAALTLREGLTRTDCIPDRWRKMWKWIGGIFAVIVLCLAAAGWFGYRKYQQFTAGGNSTRIAIHASQERVFSSLANADSLAQWTARGGALETDRHGLLKRDDVLRIRIKNARGDMESNMTWTVTEVRPNQLIAMEVRSDSSNKVFATRRDSLVAAGDSTIVISTLSSPIFDAVQTRLRDSSRRAASAIMEVGSKFALSAFRVQAEHDLERLKARIERVLER